MAMRLHKFILETRLWIPLLAALYCAAVYAGAKAGLLAPVDPLSRSLLAWSLPFALLIGMTVTFAPPRSMLAKK
ncbi:hypothetical protein [Stenotrophomonas maltophilia]